MLRSPRLPIFLPHAFTTHIWCSVQLIQFNTVTVSVIVIHSNPCNYLTHLSAHALTQEGLNYRAIFSLLNSPVQALQFSQNGAKLAAGYECGRVSVLFFCFEMNVIFQV